MRRIQPAAGLQKKSLSRSSTNVATGGFRTREMRGGTSLEDDSLALERVLQPQLTQRHLGLIYLLRRDPFQGATSTRSVSFKPAVAANFESTFV